MITQSYNIQDFITQSSNIQDFWYQMYNTPCADNYQHQHSKTISRRSIKAGLTCLSKTQEVRFSNFFKTAVCDYGKPQRMPDLLPSLPTLKTMVKRLLNRSKHAHWFISENIVLQRLSS